MEELRLARAYPLRSMTGSTSPHSRSPKKGASTDERSTPYRQRVHHTAPRDVQVHDPPGTRAGGVDPFTLLIDRSPADNVKGVTVEH